MSEELTKRMFNTLKCLAEAVNHSIRTHAASLQLAWPADFLPASTIRLFLVPLTRVFLRLPSSSAFKTLRRRFLRCQEVFKQLSPYL